MVGFFEDAVGFLLYSGLFVVVTKGGSWVGLEKEKVESITDSTFVSHLL